MDKVILKNLRFDLVVGLDAWRRWDKPQPVLISLEVQPTSNFEGAAAKDDVSLTMDYGKLYKKISSGLALVPQFATVQMLITQLSELVTDYLVLDIDILLPKAILRSRSGVLYRSQFDKSASEAPAFSLSMTIKQIACDCIIGVNPHERLYKQSLFFDISVPFIGPVEPISDNAEDSEKLHNMVQEVIAVSVGLSYAPPSVLTPVACGRFLLSDGRGSRNSSGPDRDHDLWTHSG